jgi:hypothetical protein
VGSFFLFGDGIETKGKGVERFFFLQIQPPIDKKRVLGFLQAIFNFREDERSDFFNGDLFGWESGKLSF